MKVTDKLNKALAEAEEKAKIALSKYQSAQEDTGKMLRKIATLEKEGRDQEEKMNKIKRPKKSGIRAERMLLL